MVTGLDDWPFVKHHAFDVYPWLEEKFQRDLDRARTADLIKGAECSASQALPAKILAQRRRGLTKLRRGRFRTSKIAAWRSEVWMVKDIEHFCAKL